MKNTWYSSHKKLKAQSSSSVANTVTKASDVDKNSVEKSAKVSSTVEITGSSSLKKQKDLTIETAAATKAKATTTATTSNVKKSDGLIKKSECPYMNCDPAITLLLNYFSDITQAPPPPAPKPTVFELPTNIALPPISAAKQSNPTSSNNAYSLADIETLLSNETINTSRATPNITKVQVANTTKANDTTTAAIDTAQAQDFALDCLSPSSSSTVNTPKDASTISWIDDLDFSFDADITQSKFDPLQGDNEFDSLLGI